VSPRRSGARAPGGDLTGRKGAVALGDEREFLEQSIADLENERTAGEVDEGDFAVLRARYGERLTEVEAAMVDLASVEAPSPGQVGVLDEAGAGAGPVPEPRSAAIAGGTGAGTTGGSVERHGGAQPGSVTKRLRRRLGSRRSRLVIGIAAAACFAVAATLLAASLAGVRLPGESATGSVSLSSAQQEQETLDRAAILGSAGEAAEAVQLYNQVLRTDPDQPNALTYGGWLVRLAGLSSKNQVVVAEGDASVAKAVKVAPGYADAHALFGVILYEDFARPDAAVVQFRDAASRGGSKNLLMSVASIAAKAFAAARQPLPSSYAAAGRAAPAAGTG